MLQQTQSVKVANADDFRKGMRRLAAAVNVISTDVDGELHGLLATAVCSVSAEPPTLLICINKDATACAPIAASKRFCVNVLSQKQFTLAQEFLTLKSSERLSLCSWQRLATGAPVIDGALASFDCEVAQVVDAGTHTIYFGKVMAVALSEADAPLLYFGGGYAELAQPT